MILIPKFKKYLFEKNLSKISIKNYLADINKFLKWFEETGKNRVTVSLIKQYIQRLRSTNLPGKTVKRYLSSFKHFVHFLSEGGQLNSKAIKEFDSISLPLATAHKANIKILLDRYGKYLKTESYSQTTIKNYLADTRQFLEWLEVR